MNFLKLISTLILILFVSTISYVYASYIIPNQTVTQIKLAPRPTGSVVTAGGVATSSNNSGSYTTTSTTATAVTNLTVTITTTGRPVYVAIQSPGNGSLLDYIQCSSATILPTCVLYFYRDGSAITQSLFEGAAANTHLDIPPSSFSYVDFPTAGTHTYTVQVRVGNSAITMSVNQVKLLAYEL